MNKIRLMAIVIIIAIVVMPFCITQILRGSIGSDYSQRIKVDDSAKVEAAVSSLVSNMKERGFVVVRINVSKIHLTGEYVIACYGIDKANLLSQ